MRKASALPLLLALLAAACGASPEQTKADREEIRRTLEEYLPRLARAYATGDIEQLRGMAVEKEMARVEKLVSELADQGQALAPTLEQLTVEDVTLWSHNNAYVTTLEVWDVRSVALGSDRQLSEIQDRAHRVKYQLKRRAEGWEILYREVEQTIE